MRRSVFCMICIFFGGILTFSTQAHAADLTKNVGIGLQGATPAFGGISLRYTGLAPVHLQAVGRFILNEQHSDHMLGGGISYAIFEHQSRWNISRLYFTLAGAWQYEKKRDSLSEEGNWQQSGSGDILTTRLGAGIAFGGEIVFSLGGIPLGLNIEVGQGFGRENVGLERRGLAGVYIGGGVHAYF